MLAASGSASSSASAKCSRHIIDPLQSGLFSVHFGIKTAQLRKGGPARRGRFPSSRPSKFAVPTPLLSHLRGACSDGVSGVDSVCEQCHLPCMRGKTTAAGWIVQLSRHTQPPQRQMALRGSAQPFWARHPCSTSMLPSQTPRWRWRRHGSIQAPIVG